MHVLIIFVKNAELGKVKTRLAKTVGNQKALEIYQQLLAFTRDVTRKIPVEKQVWYSSYLEQCDPVFSNGYSAKVQAKGDLGDKMKEAFSQAFEGGSERVVIIGSDCAELDGALIKEAFEKLQTNDVVIGPAQDGGYYLLGMNGFYSELFDDIEWSTNSVFTQTRNKVDQMQLACFELKVLSDVDNAEDWERVKHKFVSHD